jgi:hypothetical protein
MSRRCPIYGSTVLYLDCLECDEKPCRQCISIKKNLERRKSNEQRYNDTVHERAESENRT